MSNNDAAAGPLILILRTHDSAGIPAPAQFVAHLDHRTVTSLGSNTMDVIRPLNPRRTSRSGVYTYVDPLRGSGEIHLQGFSDADAQRVYELVRMHEISVALGPEPLRPADLAVGTAITVRTRNPWLMLAFGAVLSTFGVVLLVRSQGADLVAYVVMGILLCLVGAAVMLVGAIRLPWWIRARRHARNSEELLPPDLKGL